MCVCVLKKKDDERGDLKIILKILQKRRSTNSSDLTQILTALLEVGKFPSIHESCRRLQIFPCVFFTTRELKNANLVQERRRRKKSSEKWGSFHTEQPMQMLPGRVKMSQIFAVSSKHAASHLLSTSLLGNALTFHSCDSSARALNPARRPDLTEIPQINLTKLPSSLEIGMTNRQESRRRYKICPGCVICPGFGYLAISMTWQTKPLAMCCL